MVARARIETAIVSAGAAVLVALLCARALLRPVDSWDAWAYHLPFAARLWDIVPRSSLELDDHLELLFRAYPVGVEWLQGALWKLTGRLQAASFVSLGALMLFIELLHRRFGVARATSVFALLAIPVVQTHATDAYVDLPANLAAAAAVLLTHRAWTSQPSEASDAWLAALCAAFAASSKFQMAAIACLVAVALAALFAVRREARTSTGLAVYAFALVVAAYPYLRNTVVFGAPFFPVSTAIFFRNDSHSLAAYQGPEYLARWPGPARWLVSVLGWGELDASRGMFSIDAAVDRFRGPTSLMGGYFGPWVACQAVFFWRLNRTGSRAARGALLTLSILTALVSVSPESHQLRYYMFWILVLVGLNLSRLSTLPEAAPFGSRLFTRLSLVAFALVTLLTRGRFLALGEQDRPIARFVESRVPLAVVSRLKAGGRYCLIGQPFPPLALTSELSGRGPYSLKSSSTLEPCADRERVWMTQNAEAPR